MNDTILSYYFSIVFWLIIHSSFTIKAQLSLAQLKHLGKEEGLINNEGNYFVSEDSQGFIWISSQNGFYRFDGISLKYYLIPADKTKRFIPDQNIQSTFWEDTQSQLWFTSYNSLHCLNKATNQIRSYQAPLSDSTFVNDAYHIFHLEKKTNHLWLRAGTQVWSYNIHLNSWQPLFPTNGVRFAALTNTNGRPSIIISCPWVKAALEVHFAVEDGNWSSRQYFDNDFEIRNALIKNDSVVWLFTDLGLLEFDFIEGKLLNHFRQTDRGLSLNLFNGLYLNNEKKLFLASSKDGIVQFNLETQSFYTASNNPSFSSQLASLSPRAFYKSNSGQLWISHKNNGVDYSINKANAFKNYFHQLDKASVKIDFFLEDQERDIWQLSDNGQLFLYENGKQSALRIDKAAQVPPLKHMGIDDKGSIWFISDHQIFRLLAKQSDKSIQLEEIINVPQKLISIFLGIPNRMLFITQNGVFDLIEEEEQFKLELSKELASYDGYNFYHFYSLDSTNYIVPYESKELWFLRKEKRKWRINKKLKIGGDTFSGLLVPASKSIWFGNNLGLFSYQKEEVNLIISSIEDLQGASVYGVLPDNNNNLWLSTNAGLKRYNINSEQLIHFFESDGIASNQFSPYAYLKSSNGNIWMGSEKGLTVFHPDSVQLNTHLPKAYLEALWINNLPIELDTSINFIKKLSLNYLQNTLAFELKAIGFQDAQKNKLKYRLLGYDDNWVSIPNGNFARFTKVPPGDYLLEILPINANNIEGKAKYLPIKINPPFWQTLWFKVASVFGLFLVITSMFRIYYGQKLRKQQQLLAKEQALNEERNRIAKELHDDMGSSLSSILFLSEDLLLDADKEKNYEVERISALAENSLENMREIIWALDKDKNTLDDLSSHLRVLITQLLRDNKIAFELDIDLPDKNQFNLGSEVRRNIYLIIKEALHNVIKHANAGQVKASVKLEGKQLYIKIKDDGRGFEKNSIGTSGYGLSNMKERATSIGAELKIETALQKGATLSLIVPL